MPAQTKATLQSNSSATYLDNVTGSITPTIVRTFTSDMIDSWLNQIVPGTGTAAGSMVTWTGSSTTAQLILGIQGAPLYVEGTTPTWMPSGVVAFNQTAAPQISILNSVDSAGVQIGGPAHTVQVLEDGSGATIKTVSNGQINFGTSNTSRMVLQTNGGLFATGLASQGSGTANFNSFFAGIAGTAAGLVAIAGSTSPSLVNIRANPTGTNWALQLQPSAGASASLFGLTGATSAAWITVGQVPGVQDGSAASAGNIGELMTSSTTTPGLTLTNNNASNVRSLTLTAGDWNVWGNIGFSTSATAPVTQYYGGITTSSATVVSVPGSGAQAQYLLSVANTTAWLFPVGMAAVSVTTNTPIFLVGLLSFASGSASGFGFIGARRVR